MSGRLVTGLVSVTFRKLTCEEIVREVAKAGLRGIEWGGDVHVPAGDRGRAKEVGKMTREAGLRVMAYGSYYRVGALEGEEDKRGGGAGFAAVLESAVELGAPVVRVWAGSKGSQESDGWERGRVVEDARRIAEMAEAAGVKVCSEWHGGTLTDEVESGVRFLEEVGHKNFRTLWQTTNGRDGEYCVETLRRVLGRVENVHCFHWGKTSAEKFALKEGEERWKRYLGELRTTGREHGVLLEFVKGDDVGQFRADARTLREWVGE